MADSKEAQFQQDIVDSLVASGWQLGKASQYDRATALYPEDVIAYQKAAWPERWDKLCSSNPQKPEQVLIQQVERHLKKVGTLAVLRHGFKMPGNTLVMCSFMPDHAMNPESVQRYQANILRVVPEVSYSPHAKDSSNGKASYNPRLDLVLFVNGLPVATLELKSAFKQSLEAAKRQYRKDRPLKDPITRKEEPLLAFKRGALVHFVARQDEIAMTTRLAGDKTFFLPFNRGSEEGGAGNPPAEDANSYATDYLWKQVLQPDAWLKIISRFLHLEEKTSEDFAGNRITKETMIFPRFHQWQVVNQLLDATRNEGAGNRYLIQHSAGSGKSNSIAWTAHQLANLYAEDGSRMFNSVIVVTDRTVLDSQLQNTIYQFEHAHGVVCPISREGASASKSAQLADALAANTRIIIVTLQTFPALFDALEKRPKLAQGHYAVIADEAHSSQTGSSAGKLKSLLNSAGQTNDPEAELSSEEVMEAAVAARSASQRISYYAFTATPKGRTLELFGVRPEPELPASDSNKPRPFHLYSMRQAIEEGFILDVLRRYTTYKTAWKLSHPDGEEIEVDSKKASRTLARWVRLHPHNINQRVEVIVEHFRHNVRHLLNGQAKAMVVTSSRQEAVRYQLAMLAYVKDKGYDDVHPLVAFSGSVPADDVIPEEVSEASALLNAGVKGRDLATALESDDFNVMIAANKYQTGFDQPKLCAMYVDKKLQKVECVQTLSRLNRLFPGKETFILDFFNDTQDILDAFAPYYRESELATVSDPQVIYDMQQSLDDTGIYHGQEVTQFAEAFFDPKAPSSKLSFYCDPARDRFNKRYVALTEQIRVWRDARNTAEKSGDEMGLKRAEQELKDAGTSRDELDLFRKNLKSFVRAYEFLSQIIAYEDTELEQLCVFAKHLSPLLREDRLGDPELDVSELELTHYRQTKHQEQELRLEEEEGEFGLDSITEVGSGTPKDPEKKKLDEIIDTLNDLYGAEIQDDDKLHFAKGLATRLERDEDLMGQVNSYSLEDAMKGLLPKRLNDVLLDALADQEKMSMPILEDGGIEKRFAHLMYQLLRQRSEGGKGVQG